MPSSLQFLRSWIRDRDPWQALAFAALIALLLFAWQLRRAAIERAMPYPQHIDEIFVGGKAGEILRSGDLDPHFFMYPGLPIHLAAAAMAYGYLDAANHLELQSTAEIGAVTYPYYEHPRVVRPARLLFAAISVAGLALLAWAARQLGGASRGGAAAMVLAPAWLTLSWIYFEQSQAYLNVNVMGCALAWLLLGVTLSLLERPDWTAKVLAPGILVGLTAACKYNFAGLLLAPLLAIFFHGGERRAAKATALAGLTVASFLLAAPYTLLDFKTFLDGLGKITYVYRSGFFGRPDSQTFWSHLWLSLRELQQDLGAGGTPFVILGTLALARRDPRRALIVAVFPLLLLVQMSGMPTHMMRNLLPLLPLWTLCGALGVVAAARFLAAKAPGWKRPGPPWRACLALALLLLPALYFLPLGAPGEWLKLPMRSRQDGTAWLIAHAGRSRPLLVASELGLHPLPLQAAGFELQLFRARSLSPEDFATLLAEHPGSWVLLPRFDAAHWDPPAVAEAERLLPRLAALHAELEPLQEFGSRKVSACFDAPLGGDPQFVIGRRAESTAPPVLTSH